MTRRAKHLFSPQTPGQALREHVVDSGKITQDVLAKALGVSRLSVNQLLNGKRTITAEMALRLSRVLATSPEFWLNLQRDFDLFEAERRMSDELKRLPVLRKVNPITSK